jgi:hypothetical protein
MITKRASVSDISDGGVCRGCGLERLVLMAKTGICLTCAIDGIDDAGDHRPTLQMRTRRPVREPRETVNSGVPQLVLQ